MALRPGHDPEAQAAGDGALSPDALLQRAMSVFDHLAPQPTLWDRIVATLTTERKRAQEAARETQAIFRLLFASNPHPMWLYDIEGHRFLEANEAAVAHYGYSRAEFLQMRASDIQKSGDTDIPGEPRLGGQNQHRLKSGEVIDVELSSHTLKYAGRRVALLSARDITHAKRSEEALRRSEARYRSLIQ